MVWRGISRRKWRERWRDEVNKKYNQDGGIGERIGKGKSHVREKRGDLKGEGRNERVMQNKSELSLVSGVGLNGKKDDKGDMEKERDGWRGVGERFVCFFTTLCGLVISWEEVREMVGLLFSFCSFLGFCFSLWFLQTNCSISPCLPLPPVFYFFSFYLSRLFLP